MLFELDTIRGRIIIGCEFLASLAVSVVGQYHLFASMNSVGELETSLSRIIIWTLMNLLKQFDSWSLGVTMNG